MQVGLVGFRLYRSNFNIFIALADTLTHVGCLNACHYQGSLCFQ